MDTRFHNPLPQIHFIGHFANEPSVGFHSHKCDEIVLVTEGECSVDVADKQLFGQVGSLFVLPRDVLHNQRNKGFVRTIYIGFIASENGFSTAPRVLELEQTGLEKRWIEDISALQKEAPQHKKIVMESLLLAMLERLNHLEQRHVKVQERHPAVAQVVQLFETDLKGVYSLEELANLTHFSPSHLTALFNRQFDCGPLRYQQNLRLHRAKALLSDPYLSVAEIAAQVGYTDANYFTRLFRQRYGQSPRQWRNDK